MLFITLCNASFPTRAHEQPKNRETQNTQGQKNKKNQNEVIQVRCVEIPTQAKQRRQTKRTRRREWRTTGTQPQRKALIILSSYWSPPKLLGSDPVPSGDRLPPPPSAISVCYQGNVTRGDAHQSCRFKPQHFGANAVFQRTTKGTHEHYKESPPPPSLLHSVHKRPGRTSKKKNICNITTEVISVDFLMPVVLIFPLHQSTWSLQSSLNQRFSKGSNVITAPGRTLGSPFRRQAPPPRWEKCAFGNSAERQR